MHMLFMGVICQDKKSTFTHILKKKKLDPILL